MRDPAPELVRHIRGVLPACRASVASPANWRPGERGRGITAASRQRAAAGRQLTENPRVQATVWATRLCPGSACGPQEPLPMPWWAASRWT